MRGGLLKCAIINASIDQSVDKFHSLLIYSFFVLLVLSINTMNKRIKFLNVSMRTLKKTLRGFTLVELLVVIAIIGLLSTLAVVSLNSARGKARDAKRLADIRQIQTAMELYYQNASTPGYPAGAAIPLGSATAAKLCDAASSSAGFQAATVACSGSTLMGSVPSAPAPQDGSCTSGNNAYVYTVNATSTGYSLGYCIGATTSNVAAGPHTATEAGIQ